MAEDAYFKNALRWDEEIVAGALKSRKIAWFAASGSFLITLIALAALILLLPLKTFEPYVVTVDRQTGYLEVAKGLASDAMTTDDAVTESNLVRYVSMREQYNSAILRENYHTVSLMSAEQALNEYKGLWSASNPNNPSVTYGTNKSVAVRIKSVSFISDKIAAVRFIRTTHSLDQDTEGHFNATITFRYTDKPMRMADRFENPLGFQVTSYRVNPETAEKNL